MTQQVMVVGAALMDLIAHARVPLVPRTSNPARLLTSPGGVGRNIAENLARLGTPTCLFAVIGPDPHGDTVLSATRSAGVDVSGVLSGPEPTGTYLAVLDTDGELSVALSDLAGTEALTPARLAHVLGLLPGAAALVIDANLPMPVVAWLLDSAAEAGVRVVLDPVSVVKGERLGQLLRPDRPIWLLSTNTDEVEALGGLDRLRRNGVQTVWLRRGPDGSTLYAGTGEGIDVPAPAATVVDVTGAGDAATAGYLHAALAGLGAAQAAAYGHACAALTIARPQTVRPDLTDALVRAQLGGEPR